MKKLKRDFAATKQTLKLSHLLLIEGFQAAVVHNALLAPGQAKHLPIIQEFCKKILRTIHVDLLVHGTMPSHHALWVSNHISWVDAMVLIATSPAFCVAKKEVFDIPLFGRIFRAAGVLKINRGSGDSGSVADQIAVYLKKNIPVFFFPEATTSNGHGLKKMHGKLLKAALDANVPVQPVVLCYTTPQRKLDDAIPFFNQSIWDNMVNIANRPYTQTTAHVFPLAAISPVGHTLDSLRLALQNAMEHGLKDLHQRVASASI